MKNFKNRSLAWKKAKLSGHKNEEIIGNLIKEDLLIQEHFLSSVGKNNQKIIKVEVEGINQTSVNSVFPNEKTKSKTDMKIFLEDGSKYNISIKKSLSGQLFIIGINRFINGFELQFKKSISDNVKKAIYLFWGGCNKIILLISEYGTNIDYETRKHRLVAQTIKKYNIFLHNSLIAWFKNNITEITEYCFSRGLVKDKSDWADIIWYKNVFGENSTDEIFLIDNLCSKINFNINNNINYGKKNGGTTIHLPFGFVQWHSPDKKIPGSIQFHHKFNKIYKLLKEIK